MLSAADFTPAAYIQSLSKSAMTEMHKVPLFSSSAAKNLVWKKREREVRGAWLQKNSFLPFWGGCYLESENA